MRTAADRKLPARRGQQPDNFVFPSFDSRKHPFWIGGPHEGFWIGVGFCDEAIDRGLKIGDGTSCLDASQFGRCLRKEVATAREQSEASLIDLTEIGMFCRPGGKVAG
jgi:hypothetical protein